MNTATVLTFKAKKGMVIAEDILTSSGQLLIPKNTVFDNFVKNTLYSHAILDFTVWTDDDSVATPKEIAQKDVEFSINATANKITEDIKPVTIKASHKEAHEYLSEYEYSNKNVDDIDFENRILKIKKNPDFIYYDKMYSEAVTYFREDLNDIVFKNKKINLHKILDVPLQIINSNIPTMNVFDLLLNMSRITDPIYSHSFNVSLICGVIGEWLRLSEHEIQMLMLSGLLHDIGKLLLPDNILNKTDALTDQEYMIIRSHTILGYNAIKNQSIDPRIKACVLMHHEKCDGTGYPSRTTGNMLPEFVKILTIADIFDAMVCARKYRKSYSPFEVISLFEYEGFQKYDTKILLTFLQHVGYSYINSKVKLNTGQIGRVAAINERNLSKPIIEVDNELIDLSNNKNISIIGIL